MLENTSGVSLPEGSNEIFTVVNDSNPKSWWISGHVTLPDNKVNAFLKKNGMVYDPYFDYKPFPGMDQLPNEYKAPINESNLFYVTRPTGTNRFVDMMLDTATGDLWIYVSYQEH